jgi:DegV family protein with EDD domain
MSGKKTFIITDSTNDLPDELIKQYGIVVVPLTINWDGKSYLDGVDLSPIDFYNRLESSTSTPTTSQPAPGDFLKAYEAAKQAGAEQIIVITISSAMSGTFESARTAAKNIDIPVHLIDSKSNSMSLGWQLLACARVNEKGGDLSDMLAAVEKVRSQLHYHIVLDTLAYLFKGGRIAGAAKLVNGVLKIKPQIRVNHNSGTVEPGDISRTRTKALESLYSSFFKKVDITKSLRVAVLHNNALEEANALAEKIRLEFNPVELIVGIVSPVLGVHTGPRAIALCGYSEA